MKISIGTTYYNNPEHLNLFIKTHIDYFDEMIIVDDGSTNQAINHIKNKDKIKLYRVPVDYGFNSHGCRNLIMKETVNNWVVLMDVDRIFIDPAFAIETIKNKNLNVSTLYLFEMFANHKDILTLHPSVNDFLINKHHFWKAGGYDEELLGVRAGDREYREQLQHFGDEKILYGVQARFTRMPSVNLNITSPNDVKLTHEMMRIIDQRIQKPEPDKKTLTFKWERLF